ncbi:MAG: PorV/PorQ family protein [Elusimicrobiota bacterium]|nr:PorV/PorQ family protein [Elusimicrobiota bacterium]
MKKQGNGQRSFLAAALMPGLLLCAIALPAPLSAAGFGSGSAGTSSGQFLKIAAGARGAALGEAYSALADDAFALDWNPAGLINIKKNSMAVMHAPYLAGTFADYFAYAESAGEVGSWGVAFKYMNYGKMNRTDSSGMVLGTFTPYDASINVGFACYITGFNKDPEERFVLGATGKFVKSKILSDDNTVSADIGLNLPYMFDNRFRMSLTAQNIMGTLRYDKEEAPLPLILRFGIVTKMTDYFSLTSDIIAANDNMPFLAMGGELKLPIYSDMDASLRAGFNTRAISDVGGARNVSFGGGLRYTDYQLDYAFSPFGDLGSVHRISAAITF